MPGRQQAKQLLKPEEASSTVAATAATTDDAVVVNEKKELSSAKAKTKDEDDKNKSKRNHDSQADGEEEEEDDDDDGDDTAACCLCHAAVDFSDLEWFGQGDDIVAQLPKRWHDPNNALIYCDGCNRMYHQKCHFVPLLSLPRGDWFCLICQYTTEQEEEGKKKKKKNNKKNNKGSPTTKGKRKHQNSTAPKTDTPVDVTTTTDNTSLATSIIYPLLTPDNYQTQVTTSQRHQDAELKFEFYSRHLKASLWKQELHTRFTRSVAQLVQSLQQAQTELETLTSSHRNRQYFIESTQKQLLLPSNSMHSTTKSSTTTTATAPPLHHPKNNTPRRIQQQLHQTVYQYAWRKFQLRQALVNLSSIIQDTDQTWQELQYYLQHQQPSQGDSSKTTDQQQQKSLAAKCFPFGQPDPEDIDNNDNPDGSSNVNNNKTSDSLYRRQRRLVPRTREWKRHVPTPDILITETAAGTTTTASLENGEQQPQVPTEINVDSNSIHPKPPTQATNSRSLKNGHHHHDKNHGKHNHTSATKKNNDDEDDSGITLNDLRCCVCFKGDASDENDLILCDGQGCCRAYHVHCLDPPPSADMLEQEDEDWFCPMCSTLAQSLLQVQAQYLQDEDWQLQRQHTGNRKDHHRQSKENDMDVASVKSWENAFHAFPEAPWQYETALLLKQGQHNDDTDLLLRQILGLDQPTSSPNQHDNDNGDDMDDEQEDENFDLESFEAKRRKGTAAGDNHPELEENEDNSSRSSEASLVDVSSVELEISDDELNALSGQEEDDDEDDHKSDDEKNNDNGDKEIVDANEDDQKENGTNQLRRPSRRLLNGQTNDIKTVDVGQLNRDNIIWSKRQRKVVDYRRLNDALFGDLNDEEKAKIDDTDDFVMATSSSRKTSSTPPCSASSVSGEENEEEEEADDNGDEDNEEDELPQSDESDDEESDSDDGDSNAAKEERPPKRRRTTSGASDNDKSSKSKDKKGKLEPTKKAKRNTKHTSAKKKKADASVTRKRAGASTAPASEKMTTRRNGTHAAQQSKPKTRKAASSAVAAHRNSKGSNKRTSKRNA